MIEISKGHFVNLRHVVEVRAGRHVDGPYMQLRLTESPSYIFVTGEYVEPLREAVEAKVASDRRWRASVAQFHTPQK